MSESTSYQLNQPSIISCVVHVKIKGRNIKTVKNKKLQKDKLVDSDSTSCKCQNHTYWNDNKQISCVLYANLKIILAYIKSKY